MKVFYVCMGLWLLLLSGCGVTPSASTLATAEPSPTSAPTSAVFIATIHNNITPSLPSITPTATATLQPTATARPQPTPSPTIVSAAPGWRRIPTGSGPSPRNLQHAILTLNGDKVYIYGGRNNQGSLNDTWLLSLTTVVWQRIAEDGAPPGRWGGVGVLDTQRNRFIVVGGQTAGAFYNDTWALDLTNHTWRHIETPGALPRARYGAAGVYDVERDRVIISHGFTDSGRFDDTWALDLATNTWRDLTPDGAKPIKRCLHTAGLDRDGQQMILFGGCASGFGPCPLNDTWAFDLKTHQWRELRANAPLPPARQFTSGEIVDGGEFVIFGGEGSRGLGDTWALNPRASTWRLLDNGPGPGERHSHTTLYDSLRRRLLVMFGTSSGQNLADIWEYGLGGG